jgi:hypothetical protein
MGRGDYIGTGTSSDMLLFCHSSNNTTFRILSGATKLSQSRWYHTAFSTDGTNMKLYLNGVLDNSTASLASSPYSTIAGDIGIGILAENFSSFPWSGSIASVSIYNRVLSDAEIFNIYETTSERFNRPTLITDSDALNFLNSANIGNDTHRKAINDLVVDMKNAGLWSKMKAIYPFVGGTAASHKWNLKDPRDVDAAFRLNFIGGWTHSSTGALPNGTNGYADTFLTPNTSLSLNSNHMSFYSRTDQSSATVHELGCSINAAEFPTFVMILKYNNGSAYLQTPDLTNRVITTNTNSTGYYVGTRTAVNLLSYYKNTTTLGTNTGTHTQTQLPTVAAVISAYRFLNGPISGYSSKEVAFSTIGDGLTDTDAANLYTIVQKYQTTLGRQV